MVNHAHSTRRVKSLLAAIISATLLAGLLAAPSEAPAAAPWVKIQTPAKMKPAKKLRYRIYCREACKLNVTTKLKWPGRPNLVSTIPGTFNAGESRANILTLNNPARNTLKANWRRTILQVIIRARNLETGDKVTIKKSVAFKAP
jgi:hypothetical protein